MNIRLLAVVVAICGLGIYFVYRNAKQVDEAHSDVVSNIITETSQMEEKIKTLKEREDALLQENGKLMVQVNELKMENERLSRKQTQSKSTKHEKTVPISNSASERIIEFLSKRYENE